MQPSQCGTRPVVYEEPSQPDLYGLMAPYSETWPTSGTTRGGSAYPLPQSALRIHGSAFSSSPTALF